MIREIESRVAEKWGAIAQWFEGHSQAAELPIYSSVDIRNSGFKLAVVDTNLFPSGFNNLCQRCFVSGPELFRNFFTTNFGPVNKILILPESYTRNLPYFAHLARLVSLLEKAEFQVRVASLSPQLKEDPYEVELAPGERLLIYRARKKDGQLWAGDFCPEVLLANNDFSTGVPRLLEEVEQPLVPPGEMGWHRRRKSQHFLLHHKLVEEFCSIIDWDPWRLTPVTDYVDGLDFQARQGLDRLAEVVERVLVPVKEKYQQYGIQEEPYVFVKNDAGTFGMAIMTAASGQEILNLSHRQRTKMHKGKGGVPVTRVIVQEGIPTRDLFGKCYVEPVIYMIGGQVVGGFLRENRRVSPRDNFNTLGMTFTRPCLHGLEEDEVTRRCQRVAQPDYFPMIYDVVSRIASLAAGYELKALHSPEGL